MKKRELFDSFEQMEKSSQQMQRTIASVKEEMERIVEQNAELAIENSGNIDRKCADNDSFSENE